MIKTDEKAFGPLSWDETRELLIHGQHRTWRRNCTCKQYDCIVLWMTVNEKDNIKLVDRQKSIYASVLTEFVRDHTYVWIRKYLFNVSFRSQGYHNPKIQRNETTSYWHSKPREGLEQVGARSRRPRNSHTTREIEQRYALICLLGQIRFHWKDETTTIACAL